MATIFVPLSGWCSGGLPLRWPATLSMPVFWTMPDPMIRMMHQGMFMTNLGRLGRAPNRVPRRRAVSLDERGASGGPRPSPRSPRGTVNQGSLAAQVRDVSRYGLSLVERRKAAIR